MVVMVYIEKHVVLIVLGDYGGPQLFRWSVLVHGGSWWTMVIHGGPWWENQEGCQGN